MIDLNLCDQQQINALLKIKETGNTALIALLEGQIDKAVSRLIQADDMALIHRLQGRCEAEFASQSPRRIRVHYQGALWRRSRATLVESDVEPRGF